MNREFFMNNRRKFAKEMRGDSLAVFFSGTFIRDTCDQLAHPFSVERNFYYLTGIDSDGMMLLLHKTEQGLSEYLFILPVDEHYEKWQALMMRPPQAREISGIENILYTYEFDKKVASLMYGDEAANSLYVYSSIAAMHEPLTPAQAFAKRFRELYPSAAILNSLDSLAKLRACKNEEEIAEIQVAADLACKALEYTAAKITPGIYEYQIKAHYQHYLLMNNSKPRFRSIVAAGKNATILHYNTAHCQVQDGDLVLIDAGAMHNWYVSDLTRTFPVSGKFTPRQRTLYNIVLDAELLAIDKMRIGVTEYEVDKAIHAHYAKALKSLGLIKDDRDVGKYYYHDSGHHIGLDLHEIRDRQRLYTENCVHTIEPGLYIAEEGLGIRIEDNVLVTKNGARVLSASLPKTADDIENLMASH